MKINFMYFYIIFMVMLIGKIGFAGVGASNASGVNLGFYGYLKCSTGMTCSKEGKYLKMVSSPSLVGPLTLELGVAAISNPTSYDVSVVSSGDSSVTVKGYEGKSASLRLWADEGDDAADKFSIVTSQDNTTRVFVSDSVQSFSVEPVSGDITTLGSLKVEGALGVGSINSFASGDATPAVSGGAFFSTFVGNTTTITDFDGDIFTGQMIHVLSRGAVTYDVTSSGIVCGSTDVVTASGDSTGFIYDGADWRCTYRADLSDDVN